ncbi:MAG: DegV family protein [Actinomycetota bacterium]
MLANIGIVTDSTSYLDDEYIDKYDIKVVPLKVIFEGVTYREGMDITDEEFFRRLKHSDTFPTTSQPAAGEFLEAYQEMANRYDALLSIHISEGISGTCDAARMAAREMGDFPIEIIDSRLTTGLLGMIAMELAEARDRGMNMAELKAMAGRLIKDSTLMFMVATLEYLHRGGRIGGAQALLGTMLQMKPILFIHGMIDVQERVRGAKKAMDRLVEIAIAKAGGKKIRLGISHVEDPERADELRNRVEGKLDFDPEELILCKTGPVIGCHVGPGTAGLGFFPKE